jgi:hypothetical protein
VRLAQGFAPLYSRETCATKISKALLKPLYAVDFCEPGLCSEDDGVARQGYAETAVFCFAMWRMDLAVGRLGFCR